MSPQQLPENCTLLSSHSARLLSARRGLWSESSWTPPCLPSRCWPCPPGWPRLGWRDWVASVCWCVLVEPCATRPHHSASYHVQPHQKHGWLGRIVWRVPLSTEWAYLSFEMIGHIYYLCYALICPIFLLFFCYIMLWWVLFILCYDRSYLYSAMVDAVYLCYKRSYLCSAIIDFFYFQSQKVQDLFCYDNYYLYSALIPTIYW